MLMLVIALHPLSFMIITVSISIPAFRSSRGEIEIAFNFIIKFRFGARVEMLVRT